MQNTLLYCLNATGGYTLLCGLYLGQALMTGLVDFKLLEQQQPSQQHQQQQQVKQQDQGSQGPSLREALLRVEYIWPALSGVTFFYTVSHAFTTHFSLFESRGCQGSATSTSDQETRIPLLEKKQYQLILTWTPTQMTAVMSGTPVAMQLVSGEKVVQGSMRRQCLLFCTLHTPSYEPLRVCPCSL